MGIRSAKNCTNLDRRTPRRPTLLRNNQTTRGSQILPLTSPGHSFCSTSPKASFRPDHNAQLPTRAGAIKVGRHANVEAGSELPGRALSAPSTTASSLCRAQRGLLAAARVHQLSSQRHPQCSASPPSSGTCRATPDRCPQGRDPLQGLGSRGPDQVQTFQCHDLHDDKHEHDCADQNRPCQHPNACSKSNDRTTIAMPVVQQSDER
jgi:hypothetical protein